MTNKQKIAIRELKNNWEGLKDVRVVDTNFHNEPIVYATTISIPTKIKEFVISGYGEVENTATHDYNLQTSALMAESLAPEDL